MKENRPDAILSDGRSGHENAGDWNAAYVLGNFDESALGQEAVIDEKDNIRLVNEKGAPDGIPMFSVTEPSAAVADDADDIGDTAN